MNPLRMTLAVAAVAAISCDASEPMRWNIRFENDALRQRAARVEAAIRKGSCKSPGEDVYRFDVDLVEGSAPPVPDLAKGKYAVEATAHDDDCVPYAYRCATVELPASQTVNVNLVLAPRAGGPACPADRCVDAVCEPVPGKDAGTVVPDAGDDSGTSLTAECDTFANDELGPTQVTADPLLTGGCFGFGLEFFCNMVGLESCLNEAAKPGCRPYTFGVGHAYTDGNTVKFRRQCFDRSVGNIDVQSLEQDIGESLPSLDAGSSRREFYRAIDLKCRGMKSQDGSNFEGGVGPAGVFEDAVSYSCFTAEEVSREDYSLLDFLNAGCDLDSSGERNGLPCSVAARDLCVGAGYDWGWGPVDWDLLSPNNERGTALCFNQDDF